MKTIHTFKIVNRNEEHYWGSQSILPETTMTIDQEASLSDMLYAFERFLEASGYVLPDNSELDFVTQEENFKEQSSYKGEF